MSARGPSRHQVVYSRLETDVEVYARASVGFKHQVGHMCCAYAWGRAGADDIADGHGVTRRIVEVMP